MQINKALNLVIPIIRSDETKLYIHSTPIRPETFETYYMVLAKAFSAMAQNGLDPRSGPSVAAMVLKEVAQSTPRAADMNWWEGPDGVGGEGGLLAEIIRLSNAILPGQSGWTTTPLKVALDQNLMDEEESREVQNILAFFIVTSAVAPRVDRPKLVRGLAAIYELQTTSLNSTEFLNSLKTSTTADNSGKNEQP